MEIYNGFVIAESVQMARSKSLVYGNCIELANEVNINQQT